MTVYISLLRAINVGGHKKIGMAALRDIYESIGLRGAQTLLQSGNVVFESKATDQSRLAERIGEGIEESLGFRPEVILRGLPEWRETIARNPFAGDTFNPSRLLVMFLAGQPDKDGMARLLATDVAPEKTRCAGCELYLHCVNGVGGSKLGKLPIEKLLKTRGTARNWNTVTKLLDVAETLAK